MDTRIWYLLVVVAAFAYIALQVSRADRADAAALDHEAEQQRRFESMDRDWY